LRADAAPLVRAYVTAYTDEQGLETALKLRHELAREVPLVVALSRAQGVSRVIGDVAKESGLNFEVFETLENACTVELIRGGSFEPLARAIHDRYVQKNPDAKAAKPWNELDESLKESNRAQARDIAAKLRTIGCEIGPLRAWRAADFEFTDEEVETLAKMEHERWRQQVEVSGTASQKDPETLLPFEELPKRHADKDRDSVKAIPTFLPRSVCKPWTPKEIAGQPVLNTSTEVSSIMRRRSSPTLAAGADPLQ
jgi:hypothetical protein